MMGMMMTLMMTTIATLTQPNTIPTMFQVRAEREAVCAATMSPLA